MPVKCIIFDLGGVIVDYTEEKYYRLLSEKFNIPYNRIFNKLEPLIKTAELGSISQKNFEKSIKKDLNIRSDIMWIEAFKKFGKTDKNMVELVRGLRKQYKICLLTNISRSRYATATEYFINKNNFDERFVSCYLNMRKPNANIYEYIIKKIKLPANEILFIDNMGENLINPRKLGINCILFKNYNKLISDLKKYNIKIEKI